MDLPTVGIALGTVLGLVYVKRVPEPVWILIAAVIGLLLAQTTRTPYRRLAGDMVIIAVLAGCNEPCGVEAERDADGACVTAPTTFPHSSDDNAIELGDNTVLAMGDSCASSGWYYMFDVSGQVVSATLDISGADAEAGRRAEEHPVDVFDVSHFELELELFVVDEDSEQPGASTAFGCEQRDAMTWRLLLFDALDRRSCLLWGAEPALLEVEGCARW